MNFNVIRITETAPEFLMAVTSLPKVVEIVEPIFAYRNYATDTGNIVCLFGTDPIEDLLVVGNLPPTAKVVRSVGVGGASRVVFINSSGVCSFRLLIPSTIDKQDAVEKLKVAVVSACRDNGVMAFAEGNDLKFTSSGYDKKFFGVSTDVATGGTSLAGMITFEADTAFMNSVLNFSHKALTRKGITDMSTYVGGLFEINPAIVPATFLTDVSVKLAAAFGMSYNPIPITNDMHNKAHEMVAAISDSDWVLRGLRKTV